MSRKFLTLKAIYYILLLKFTANFYILLIPCPQGWGIFDFKSNKMVTPSIEKIREVEKDCREKVNKAHLQAETIVENALKTKRELIAQAREETQKAMQELATRAEEDAQRESKKIAEKEREEIEKLREKVKGRFHRGVSRILHEIGIQLK